MRLLLPALLLVAAFARADDTLSGPDCVVRFPSSARAKAQRIVETFRSRREQAARWLGLEPSGEAEIWLVADHAAMAARAPGAPSWAVAITESDDTMVFRLDLVDRTPSNSLDLVLKHEAVHFALNHARGRFPRWFEEGLAVHHAGLAYLEPDTTIERFAAAGRLPRFADADRLFAGGAGEAALGYKMGDRVVGTFVRRFGESAVPRLVRAVAGGATFGDAFSDATGESVSVFERRWRDEVTPALPFWLFVIAENLELALFCAGGLLVVLGYVRWRLKRERAMRALGGGAEPPPV